MQNNLYSWGRNLYGQLGNGNTQTVTIPTASGLTDIKQVNIQIFSGFAIKNNNKLYSWGFNQHGVLGLGDTTDRYTPTQIGTSNWKQVVQCVGVYNYPSCIAIDEYNKLFAWGYNDYIIYTHPTIGSTYTPFQIGSSNWKTVSCAFYSTVLAIDENDYLYQWGNNYYGQAGIGSTSTSVTIQTKIGVSTWKYISQGYYASFGIASNNKLYSWGYNAYGVLGLGDTTNRYTPTQVGTSDWKQISCNSDMCQALDINGNLYTWGINYTGQLGDGTTVNKTSPTLIGNSIWKQVSVGFGENGYHTLAILENNNQLYAWGNNNYNQLGIAGYYAPYIPKLVNDQLTWNYVSQGSQSSFGIESQIYQLNLNTAGTGVGTVQINNEPQGSTASSGFVSDTSITIYATPDTYYSFTGWYNSGTLVSGNQTYTFNMPQQQTTYTAKFNKTNLYNNAYTLIKNIQKQFNFSSKTIKNISAIDVFNILYYGIINKSNTYFVQFKNIRNINNFDFININFILINRKILEFNFSFKSIKNKNINILEKQYTIQNKIFNNFTIFNLVFNKEFPNICNILNKIYYLRFIDIVSKNYIIKNISILYSSKACTIITKYRQIQLQEYELISTFSKYSIYRNYKIEYHLKVTLKENLQDVTHLEIYDIEQSTGNLFKFINLQKILNLYLDTYYNENFIISLPQVTNQLIPIIFNFDMQALSKNNFNVLLESKYNPILKIQNLKQIMVLYTPNKFYLTEWQLEYYQKLDKYIYPQEIQKVQDSFNLSIQLLDDNRKKVIFRDIQDTNLYKIDTVFSHFENININNLIKTELYNRINCNLFTQFEISQEHIVANYKLEPYLNRKRFNNIDDYNSQLMHVDGRYISNIYFNSPYYNVFDQKQFDNNLEELSKYISTNDITINPLKSFIYGNSDNYYFRNNIDTLNSDSFLIDGGLIDKYSKYNLYNKDSNIRIFYLFHKFNSAGELNYIIIYEYILETSFIGKYDLIYKMDRELNNIYIELFSITNLLDIEKIKLNFISNTSCNIAFINVHEQKVYQDNIISVNIGGDKIQLRNYNDIKIKDLEGNLIEHGSNVYSNLVLISSVFQKSQYQSQQHNTIFLRDVLKEKNSLSQYNYESFFSWIGVEF